MYFDQINTALVSIRDFCQKHYTNPTNIKFLNSQFLSLVCLIPKTHTYSSGFLPSLTTSSNTHTDTHTGSTSWMQAHWRLLCDLATDHTPVSLSSCLSSAVLKFCAVISVFLWAQTNSHLHFLHLSDSVCCTAKLGTPLYSIFTFH